MKSLGHEFAPNDAGRICSGEQNKASTMIADLKPYPDYQESGAAWIGQIPSHWATMPNRALFEEVKDRNHPDEEMLSVTITRGIIRQKALLLGTSKKDSSNLNKSAYKLVQPGDLAYNKMRAWQGAVGASHFRGIISPAYVVMRPRKGCNPAFYHHLYRTPSFQKEAERWSYGITSDMWSLRPEHFKVIYSVLPPPSEQAAIVRFLDWANGRLERAIRAKRKVIALLQEQKQAIIHKAVTQGLDPNVPKRDSGIPWLGEIPAHWEVIPIKRVASVLNGFAFPSEVYTDSGIPLIRIGDVKATGAVDIEKSAKLPTNYLGSHSFVELKCGDLVMAMTGATIGKVAKYSHDGPSLLNQRVCAFRSRSGRVKQEYLFLLLSSRVYLQQVLMACYGGAQPNISDSTLSGFKMPMAPFGIQAEIVEFVENQTAVLTTAIERYEREITLLREYRTRLVADLVTGKLDVREAALLIPADDVALAPEDLVEEGEGPELEEFEG